MRVLLFVLTIFIIFSGCIEERSVVQSNTSTYQASIKSENLSPSSLPPDEENIPEIEVRSFASICTHNNSEKVDGYLFSWENVPGDESQSLRSYLKNDLGIGWVDDAQIVKTNDNETIRVFTSENSLELRLEDNKSKILTTIDSDTYYYSQIKKENGKICVYRIDEYEPGYNITEKYYAVYNLSIKNNDSNNFDFKLNELHVLDGNHIFNATIEPEIPYSYGNEILSGFEIETKIENTTLSPGQSINGNVVFQVNSLYNESFLLMYNETPTSSAPFEKSTEALRMAEYFDYSVAFGIPPYTDFEERSSFEPNLEEYPYIWPNWVNKSVFEFFNKTDSEELLISSPYNTDIPRTESVYALKVIPARNITSIFERYIPDPHSYPENRFIVVDYTGEELINTSRIDKIAILKNQNYELHSEPNGVNGKTPQMNFSNATIVKISYNNAYGWPLGMRFSGINQDLILDDKMNIIVARYHCSNFIS